jgi:hypothetical protein
MVEIFERYAPLGIDMGGELLLRPPDALGLLSDLESVKAIILGVDTWRVVPGGIMETLQYLSLDGPADARLNAAAARNFIENVVPTLNVDYVSFVADDQASQRENERGYTQARPSGIRKRLWSMLRRF